MAINENINLPISGWWKNYFVYQYYLLLLHIIHGPIQLKVLLNRLDTPGTRFITTLARAGGSGSRNLYRQGDNRFSLSFNNLTVYIFHPLGYINSLFNLRRDNDHMLDNRRTIDKIIPEVISPASDSDNPSSQSE